MKSKTSRNMKIDHVQPFAFRCLTSVFHPDEIEALLEQGSLMESLAAGTVRPTTAEQKHFLLVDCEEAEPRSIAERAWVRLKARREFEQGEMVKAPPSPPPDYGMVEFDADRCWW
jgi:hypothetical protein